MEDAIALGGDLAGYLAGSFLSMEQPFLSADLDAIAGSLELPFNEEQEELQKRIKSEMPSTSQAVTSVMSQEEQDDELDEEAGQQSGCPKRRRRTRTERQQVLNRLAQQRYRQRKKEKVQALQCTVGSLQSQLDRLSFLENENSELRASTARLQQESGVKDAALVQVQQHLRATCQLLKSQQEKCVAQERLLSEQQQTMEAQRQQLRASTLSGMDPQALSDRLLSIIKDALNEVGKQQPSLAQPLTSDAVVQQISRTLTSCCRELVYAGKQTGAAGALASIPVSCC